LTSEDIIRFDKAIPIYERVNELEGDKFDTLFGLMRCCDLIGDRKNTHDFCNRILPLLDRSEEGNEIKIDLLKMLARVNVAIESYNLSMVAIKAILSVSNSAENRNIVDKWQDHITKLLSKQRD